ncbi:cytochrome b/b6 domain-containing protein [Hyphomonas pacifica]|uniref:Cytochrome b561 bacterial/Ni-hydrogenase domain-containing protein n=1 Tax=Hyphomonas pacifica TaxID=1280941 RepID=A0A062TTS3_9PROT|nr:cytochrome b/b6 domain-containing protein [Hyphomonas pacifica]KCZ46822.1 hypothetical protein HY2_05410 [Hyphomonas pacifica]RAN30439.1 hypothetical protein HY3_06385 [Hyphomonas pacifica]
MMEETRRVIVWDGAVRLFHWATVLLVASMWWTAEQGIMDWHKRMGLTLVALLVFRLVWGVIGPKTARFAAMVTGPAVLVGYVKDLLAGRHRPHFGHNPVGSLSVFAMLAALAAQLGTGLFTVDTDGLESGPLASLISFDAGRQAAEIHEISFNVLFTLICLHVIAIAVYLVFFKDNLVRPMVTGRRAAAEFREADVSDNRLPWVRFLIAAVVAVAAVYGILTVG